MVGEVRASGGLQTQLISDRSATIRSQGVQGLGDAVTQLAQAGLGYLDSQTEIEAVYDRRAMASKGLELDTQFLQYQQDRAKEFTEMSRERSANPVGMTRDYNEMLAKREEEFLATVPPRFQEQMKARLAQDRAQRVGSAFRGELELMDNADSAALTTGLNTLGTNLKGGAVSLEDAQEEWETIVTGSGLPTITKQEFIERGKATLQGLAFGTEIETAAAGYGAVTDVADGSDVVAAGLLPQERGVLNGIAAEESPGYDVWNGGTRFEGYSDHPAALGSAPGESTAAGRYQFILGTWRAASKAYEATYGVKVPNFSPEWQDRVALFWAEKRFNELNGEGLTFRGVLASGDPQQILKIKSVLGNPRDGDPNAVEWQGLGPMSDEKFLAIFTGERGVAGGGTGAPGVPNVWTDPRFSNVSLEQKLSFANLAASTLQQQRQQAATELKLQREQFLDAVYNAGYTGDPRAADAFRQNPNWDAEAEAKFQSGQTVFRQSEAAVAQVGSILGSGGVLSQSRSADFGRWFGEKNFVGIANGVSTAYNKMRYAVEKARYFPEGSVDAFRSALGNPQTASQALRFLASAHVGDTSILKRSGWTDDEIADVQLYANIAKRSGSPEEAYNQYGLAKDAATRLGKSPATLTKEANELWLEAYPTAEDVVDELFDSLFTESPDITLNENLGAQLMLDAGSAFQDGYKIYGTQEGAQAYMEAYVKNTWGVTETQLEEERVGRSDTLTWGSDGTRKVLMKHPPEMYYGAKDGGYEFLYQAVRDYSVANGATEFGSVLMADDQTDKEVRAGQPPTYRVIGRGEFGEAMLLPGRFGGEALSREIKVWIEETAIRTQTEARINTAQEVLNAAMIEVTVAEISGVDPSELKVLREIQAEAQRRYDAEVKAAKEMFFKDKGERR